MKPLRKTRLWNAGRTAALWVAALLGGCAVEGLNDVHEVSAELERRTGRTLNEAQADKFTLPPGVRLADGVSEDELVALALWNNAAYREILADLGLSRADLVQADMLPNPTLWMLFPMGAKPLELLLRYPVEAFWLRARRVEAAEIEVQRTVQRLVQSGLDTIRDARLACADWAMAEQRLALAEHQAALTQEIADLTRARFRAGDATELEAANAQTDALQAGEQRDRWRHDRDIARERLLVLAGLGLERGPPRFEPEPLPLTAIPDAEHLVRDALASRPDLRAAALGVEAAGGRIDLARAETFTFTAILSTKQVGSPALSGPGLDIALPIFNQNQGGVAQAQARLEKAARAYVTLRDRIVLEIREATVRLNQALESRNHWQTHILASLESALGDAERAYAAGNVSYLFVQETRRKLLDARLRAIQADADLRRAHADLERALGRSRDHSTSAPQSALP